MFRKYDRGEWSGELTCFNMMFRKYDWGEWSGKLTCSNMMFRKYDRGDWSGELTCSNMMSAVVEQMKLGEVRSRKLVSINRVQIISKTFVIFLNTMQNNDVSKMF